MSHFRLWKCYLARTGSSFIVFFVLFCFVFLPFPLCLFNKYTYAVWSESFTCSSRCKCCTAAIVAQNAMKSSVKEQRKKNPIWAEREYEAKENGMEKWKRTRKPKNEINQTKSKYLQSSWLLYWEAFKYIFEICYPCLGNTVLYVQAFRTVQLFPAHIHKTYIGLLYTRTNMNVFGFAFCLIWIKKRLRRSMANAIHWHSDMICEGVNARHYLVWQQKKNESIMLFAYASHHLLH